MFFKVVGKFRTDCANPIASWQACGKKNPVFRSERVFHSVNMGLFSFIQNDFDDIEAPRNAASLEQLEPGISAAFDQFLFSAIHGIERSTHTTSSSGLDLDEEQQFAASRDDVDLAALGCTVVPIQHLYASCSQPLTGDFFADFADLLRRPRAAVFMNQVAGRVEQPAETSDDECDKVREDGGHGDDALYHSRCGVQSHIAEIPSRMRPSGDRD